MFAKLRSGFKSIFGKLSIKELDENSLDAPINEIVNLLIKNEVGSLAAMAIGKDLQKSLLKYRHKRFKDVRPLVKKALKLSLTRMLSPEGIKYNLLAEIKKRKKEKEPFIVIIIGINGTGKTTSLAKLARYITKNGFSCVFAAGDTFRAGAITQIAEHGKNLKIRTINSQYGGDAAAVAIDAIDHAISKEVDVVLIDTAGRMQNNENLIREVQKIVKVSNPDLNFFVGDALTGNDIIRQASTFHEKVGIDGIVLTKMDADVRGGAALSISHAIKRPILFIGVGQGYDDLEQFKPEKIVKEILSF